MMKIAGVSMVTFSLNRSAFEFHRMDCYTAGDLFNNKNRGISDSFEC